MGEKEVEQVARVTRQMDPGEVSEGGTSRGHEEDENQSRERVKETQTSRVELEDCSRVINGNFCKTGGGGSSSKNNKPRWDL